MMWLKIGVKGISLILLNTLERLKKLSIKQIKKISYSPPAFLSSLNAFLITNNPIIITMRGINPDVLYRYILTPFCFILPKGLK